MTPYLEYEIEYSDDPESNESGNFYNTEQVRRKMGAKVAALVNDFFVYPYLLKLVFWPDDLTKYDLKAKQSANPDAHSCSANAEYSDQGPQGQGTYCTECGALVRSSEIDYE